MIFETERLTIQELKATDSDAFFDMMGNPNVMNPIPRNVMSRVESDAKLHSLMESCQKKEMQVWAIAENENNNFIGLCALLWNDENEPSIGYRLREIYWGVGYGTETTKGLIDYGFKVLKYQIITADVSIDNVKSVKLLEKLFTPIKEFYCVEDECTDRRYAITKLEWLKG